MAMNERAAAAGTRGHHHIKLLAVDGPADLLLQLRFDGIEQIRVSGGERIAVSIRFYRIDRGVLVRLGDWKVRLADGQIDWIFEACAELKCSPDTGDVDRGGAV